MILRDLDDRSLFLLFRPEKRTKDTKPQPVKWQGYALQLVGTKFSVSRGNRSTLIWDTFRFYQSRFVAALETWKVSGEDLERMESMKLKRGSFTNAERAEILEYCLSECRAMAMLTWKLQEAHKKAGLQLRSYYGAGSTASVLLKRMGINNVERDVPDEMQVPTAQAFFGGRFENRITGPVHGQVWSYDISSAYPYQLWQLPCLGCGSWEHTTKRRDINDCQAALVRYRLDPRDPPTDWGPLPYRTPVGSIVYPSRSGGGWVWDREYKSAERNFDGVEFREAWVYRTTCDCKPFAEIASAYVERLRLGKEGPGIVLKLGCNSVYGKLAQSVGASRPYRSMAWAGMVTSGTRAQILDALALHKNRRNLLMCATDGIYTRERLKLPEPVDTGTMTAHKKPLGGWEEKEVPGGIFAARPGIYFPLDATTEDVSAFRARGIGRKELYDNFRKIQEAWAAGRHTVKLGSIVRFHGAKSSISISGDAVQGFSFKRSDRYGQWRKRPIEMNFSPLPKRGAILKDGSLTLREMPMDAESAPYKRALICPEAAQGKMDDLIASEQPM